MSKSNGKKDIPLKQSKKQWCDWITNGITMDTVDWARKFGYHLARDISTSKLRNFYGELKRIQAASFVKEKESLFMLIPQLAYAAGKEEKRNRHAREKLQDLYEQISFGIQCIDMDDDKKGSKQFNRFVKIVEAIVAFHKEKESEK